MRIENFELKVAAKRGKKGEKGTPARVETITRDVVVVKDVAKMVQYAVEQRGMDEKRTVVRISIDGGGGSLKILGSIFHENEEMDGGLLTGVNKVLILGYTEELQETWHNLRILLELLKLDTVKYRLAADLKLINILLGISSHSGKYACFVCYGESNLVSGPLRTYKHLSDLYDRYADAKHPTARMSSFYNVIKPCLVKPSDLNLYVGDVIPIPQLHCHIGVGNWGWEWTKALMGEGRYKELERWAKKRSISVRGYHGTGLDGNNCKAFFRASKDLHLLIGAEPDAVTKACLSRELSQDWREVLERFITSVWELISYSRFELHIKISIPWKIHLLVSHLKPFLEKTGQGMADYSEQTGESGHSKVGKEMNRYKRDLDNPNHGEKMKAGCSRFNSKRF